MRRTLLVCSLLAAAADGRATDRDAVVVPRVLWANGYTFGTSESHPHAGVETSDGGFLMVGDGVDYANQSAVSRYVYALKTDKAGKMLWQTRFGEIGFNYGKFGIELGDGTLLVAGAFSRPSAVDGSPVLHRAMVRLDQATGATVQTLVMDNLDNGTHRQDGFMCVSPGEDSRTVIATGFVGGENSTSGYPDEPMFLIKHGQVFLTKLSLTSGNSLRHPDGTLVPALTVVYHKVFTELAPGWEAYQGMRLLYDPLNHVYAISHTSSNDGGGTLQMGLTATGLDGTVKWSRVYPAGAVPPLAGHKSHPYALAAVKGGGGYAIGGLAVINDAEGIEQCQGRLVAVDSGGGVLRWDKRFTSEAKDTNIECYGLQQTHDGGFILTCGTGVEPELHPHDSPRAKTWMVLVHRTNATGDALYSTTFTSNAQLQNNAGEYIVATRDGRYAVFVDSQTYGSPETGGNFALMLLSADHA